MHGDAVADPFAEYYLVQHRRRQGNDVELPNDGLLIWHVDARLDAGGNFLYDNSYTEHKLIRLMEADGLEEIDLGGRADAGDFYTPGDLFDTDTTPASLRYDGVPTNIAISFHRRRRRRPEPPGRPRLRLRACGATPRSRRTPGRVCPCPSTVRWTPPTARERRPTAGSSATAPSSGDTSASHAYVSTGTYDWTVTAELEDATCGHQGSVLVCTDFPCWQWTPSEPMIEARSQHAAVELDDGRILVVGGGDADPEIFDPQTATWTRRRRPSALISAPRPSDSMTAGSWSWAASRRGIVDSEIYDPVSDTWSTTGQLNHDRIAHSAIDPFRRPGAGRRRRLRRLSPLRSHRRGRGLRSGLRDLDGGRDPRRANGSTRR